MSGDPTEMRIAFVGDVFFGNQHPSLCGEILESFAACDATIINQEGPICDVFPSDNKKMLLHSFPEAAACLAAWGVTHATLANNHMFDHGIEGFEATQQALAGAGIEYCGAGMNATEASSPLILMKDDIRVGIIAATETRTHAILAGENSPGCGSLDRDRLEKDIRHLKRDIHHVILIPHWGYCDFTFPDIESVSLAETVLDFGASAVVGHHSHIPHGARRRNDGRFIAYSLGNFFFDYEHQSRKIQPTKEELSGTVLVLTFNRKSITEISWIFTHQNGKMITLDQQQNRATLLMCRNTPMKDLQNYPRFWKKQVALRFVRRFFFWLNPFQWRKIRLATIESLLIMAREFIRKSGGVEN